MKVILVALIAIVVFADGCGSTGTDGATGSHPAQGSTRSRSQLIAQADAICKRMNDEFATDEPRSQGIAESARIVPHRAILEHRTVAELSKLQPPTTIARSLRQIIAYRSTLARELTELGHVAQRRDLASFHELAASKSRLHAKLQAAAASAGFKECGHVG